MSEYRDFYGPSGHAAYDAIVAEQAANKCPCGGSIGGMHAVEWHEKNGWETALPPVEREISDLVNWLYAQPWGAVGGPLHIMTDDLNLEDKWFEETGFLYAAIDDHKSYYEEESPTDEEKAKCRRILELMRPMSEDQRYDALDHAAAMEGPY